MWQDRRVLVTGHTGFKGSWLALWLSQLGAKVTGFALPPPTDPSLFDAARVDGLVEHVVGDVRDMAAVDAVVRASRPEVIFHLAAQPLVRYSYDEPVETYATNVMGTVHLLEAARRLGGVKAIVCVTSDKCYQNNEWIWPYRESDPMGGHDPYSSSKGCAELVIAAYRSSYFAPARLAEHGTGVASVRAGNVIGGGDWAKDRLVPDIIRALAKGEMPEIRSPASVRPWQHVLEALAGYVLIAERLFDGNPDFAEGWNFGPSDDDTKPVSWIVDRMMKTWGGKTGDGMGDWTQSNGQHPHEATLLKLDCSKARARLGWRPAMDLASALTTIVEWHQAFASGADARSITLDQINAYQRASQLLAGTSN